MAEKRPVSTASRVFGILAIVIAMIAVAVPFVAALAEYRGVSTQALTSLGAGMFATAIALLGLIACVVGMIAGRGAQSATVIIGAFLNVGVLLGLVLAVFLPAVMS